MIEPSWFNHLTHGMLHLEMHQSKAKGWREGEGEVVEEKKEVKSMPVGKVTPLSPTSPAVPPDS